MNYSIGSTILYRTIGGAVRRVLVDEKSSDIKNGRPGFGGTVVGGLDDGMSVWGYDADIMNVE